jgi:hypothetical protein
MNAGTKRFLAIVLGTTLLACVLGIALDLVTANVAVEYFSVYHPHVVDTENPWILALVWGVIASWWAGAIAGIVVATVNYLRAQPLEAHRILRWGVVACVVLWLVMIAVLVAVYLVAGTIPEAQRRPTFEHDRRLMAVAMAHQFEYLLAGIAMLVIAIKTWWKK